jgi:hypothetical protein
MKRATDRQIVAWLRSFLKVHLRECEFYDVKCAFGLTARAAANRNSRDAVKYPCPPKKWPAVVFALWYFDRIDWPERLAWRYRQ